MSILPGSTGKHRHSILNRKMVLGGRDIYAASFVWFVVFGRHAGKPPAAIQDFRQHGLAPDMHDNKQGSIKVLWQMLVELTDSFHSTRRSADHNDVVFGHRERPSLKY